MDFTSHWIKGEKPEESISTQVRGKFWTRTQQPLGFALGSQKDPNLHKSTLPPRGGLTGGDSRPDFNNKWHGAF
jgi:hypothetical protein